ncbi:hypothetical protein ACHAWT_009323 [Skeletonema menzelii]
MLPAPESTRLVTIIAHVDHGKTTLADNLIESNGIISERLAGTLRYLDSDAEEQRRGITMRASAIGLRHVYNPPKMSSGSSASQDMVIHMIDSPGHVDFAAEVTSSLLLCDSAILVVDAVEGICARTHSLLREAYLHQLVPVLVVNKVDRLCMDLGLDPSEAYVRIRELIESMNAVCASMLNSDVNDAMEAVDEDTYANNDNDIDEKKASLWSFDPIKGNVVFASGLHGWGFTIPTLARSLFKSKTIPMKPPILRQYLFGDFKYNAETGKVLKWKQAGTASGEPMFAEYALAPLWEIYEGVSQAAASVGLKSELFAYNSAQNENTGKKTETGKILANTSGMDRVLAAIQIGSTSPSVLSPQSNNNNIDDRTIPQTTDDMQRILSRLGASSESSIVSAVLRRYRPLSTSVLDAVCETGSSPAKATLELRPKVLALRNPPHENDSFDRIQQSVQQCNPDNATVVAHVCKFASISRAAVTDPDLPSLSPDDQSSSIMMGIARVLSGTLCSGDEYYMFGPRYNGSSDDVPKQKIRCYLLMGSSFVRVNSVPAGHICAIHDLENLQLKTVTLSDKKECMPLRGFDFGLQPLVKVNVEPVNASDTENLERGLLKLSLADSSVEVTATAKGERILACLGEIHLERSILDLETVYCDGNIKIRTSDPITSFRETTTWFPNEEEFDSFMNSKIPPLRQTTIPPYCDEEGLEYAYKGRCRAVISGRGSAITMRIVPLPRSVYECLKSKKLVDGCDDDLLMVAKALKCNNKESTLTPQSALAALLDSLDDIDNNGNALLEAPILYKGHSVKAVRSTNGEVYIPRKEESSKDGEDEPENVDGLEEYNLAQECLRIGMDKEACVSETNDALNDADAIAMEKWRQDMRGSALAGFQLAMRAGPLCEEPVQGVAVILESAEIAMREDSTKKFTPAKELSGGMVVAALRSGIRCALLSRPARIVEGHLKLTLHSSLAGLGSLHAVLSKRRGRVVTDSMVDGTDLIQVTATIPQAESFGLAPELLKKSSGEVTAPELVFSHWEVLEEDPFWVPTTEDEREDHGDLTTASDSDALKYIRSVRSRKGLLVDSSKIVVAAEKQRTLSRKK